ncbi:MAG: hypothetical protein OXC06_01930 [Acidimicrobiaceae bacterium]|nr:hypothetical protein [Acidimicrobiaceae bacterium]
MGAAAAVGMLSAPRASAETGVSVVDKCPVPSDAGTRISVLILLDTSGSLRTNDPDNIRTSGTKDALLVLDSLSGQFERASISVAIDSFHTAYRPGAGWTPATGSSTALLPRVDGIAAIPEGRTTTDYTQAMVGAWERFRAQPADCHLLIWFTDGEHVTHGTADEVQPEEWAELNDLCGSPPMEFLLDNVWVGAVRLIADGGSGETLQYLFGETGRNCANPLQGEVYDDFDPADLGRVLHDIIATPTDDLIFREDDDKLPGERDDPPEAAVYRDCTGGNGTPEQPCQIPLRLDRSVESFRAFIDLTFIRQGVRNPEFVKIAVRSPLDDSGDYTTSPTIGGSGEIDPAEADGEYRLVPPFGFFTRAQYGSEIQIVGHQAAQGLADPNRWPWRWEGEWALLFYGDTPEAQADARKAAAVVRFQTQDSPVVDSFGIGGDGALSGFVDHYPDDYEDIELRVRPDAGDGEPVYATRGSLTEGPLDVVGADRRFEVPGFLDRLVHWDSVNGGGNGLNLREAIDGRGGLVAAAVLTQHFTYGGHPEALEWKRDIGGYQLTGAELQRLREMLEGRDRVSEVRQTVEDPETVWLPSGVTLGEPQVTDHMVSIPVSAVPGELAGVLALDETSVAVLDAEPVPGAEPATPDSTAAGEPATPRIEADPWNCEVPSASSHADGEFACPSLRLSIEVGQDTEMAAALRVGVAEQPGTADAVLEGLWFPPGSQEGERLSALLGERIAQQRQSVRLESGRFIVGLPVGPSGVALGAPEVAGRTVSIPVTAVPGELSGVLVLDETSVAVLDTEPAEGATSAAERAETPQIEADPWSCQVPGASGGTGGRFTCPSPLRLSVDVDQDTELAVALSMDVAERPGAADQQSVRLESDRFFVKRPPRPVETFWPMLAVLVAAALVARVLVAWRLRPWRPITSPDYVTVALHTDDSLEHAPTLAGTRRDICMDLTRRKASTDIGGVRLRSSWLPLLLGERPRLTASSASGDCIGPKGSAPLRSGRRRALVGTDLSGGWTVDATAEEPRLIVWDLPTDSQEAQDRLDDAARAAAPRLRAHRESHGAARPPQEAGAPGGDGASGQDPAGAGDAGPGHDDPFADDGQDDQYESDHDTDPFGRPTK